MKYKELRKWFLKNEIPNVLELPDGRIRFNVKDVVKNAIDYIDGIIKQGKNPMNDEHCKYCKHQLTQIHKEVQDRENWRKRTLKGFEFDENKKEYTK